MIAAFRRSFAISCLLLVLVALLCGSSNSVPLAQEEYQNLQDVYDWLNDHDLERRAMPSLRLRFGKRDMRGMWTVAQRSMPSLRLRFGKRNGEDQQLLWNEPEVERRSSLRTPNFRLRFGKRELDSQLQSVQPSSQDNH